MRVARHFYLLSTYILPAFVFTFICNLDELLQTICVAFVHFDRFWPKKNPPIKGGLKCRMATAACLFGRDALALFITSHAGQTEKA